MLNLYKTKNQTKIGRIIKMKKNRLVALVMVCAMALSLLTGCGGSSSSGSTGGAAEYSAENPLELRLASDAPAEHVATGLNNDLCALVAEKTEGRVTMKYFPSSQLGSYETVYEELMMGSIDAAQITVPDAIDARLGIAYLPYYALSYEQAKVLFAPDSYVGNLMAEITATQGVKWMGFCLEGFIGLGSTKRLTDDGLTIEADKGIKCRSANMVTFRYILEDLHYNPVAVAYNEVPTAIQTNVVDGWVGGTPNMNYAWVGDVINYMYVNYIHPEATSYVASQKTLDKLTEEDRAIVIECFEQASADSFVKAEENEKVFIQKLQDDYGVEVIEYTPEQIAPIAEYVRDVTWTRLEADLGSDFINACRADVEAKGY